jgi:RNA polymerase sigma factor (TIGR02999 family)
LEHSPGELQIIYRELRRIAAYHLRRSEPHPTLQPTILVHEAYLRLYGHSWKSRTHYMAAASKAMRQFMIDYLRKKVAQKRGGTQLRVVVDGNSHNAIEVDLDCVLDIGRLLDRLAQEEPRKASVVEMRFFGGMEFAEIAEELGVALKTVQRDWQFCRAWLLQALNKKDEA